ncbi:MULTISPECIES: SRPBCC domain-containing protein [Olivibacter]|jgi:activator of HSP90 ATPase|uniref:Activator of Hsp90 ATPase 1 family protein n=3 Tax=Sphingobacteriaceae TaxID=84566 RepID=F4C385_SPHS2|nr:MULTISPECIES: SRPBCC domain-containing protein [Olivibacter]MCL4638391.1 SRPBCC domain-containing protein [Olivibacter sp. UJ_SKK_5.1]MDM8174188.1 SRPBCC domain-containing protein [Olivibacter sp. 47]MDX3917315.1 SRPBCC domain-containing protein [Pseudosphingobacterium sp.]QEL04018.1 ATPase [Olivibacter sp. LS-1]
MKEFKQYFIIPANPEEVYLALTMEQAIRLWTGDEVSMSNTPNSEFSLWDGSITGKNLILEKDKKLVQQWYFGDQMEPSIVTIKLHPHKKGTSLELLHTNIPDTDYQDIVEGWQQVYMASLIDFFEGE